MIVVNVFNDTERKRLPRKHVQELVENVLRKYGLNNTIINVIYVDDNTILEINKDFLKHNFVTDVITFDLTEKEELLGEIYISADTAEKQSKEYNVSLSNELKRLAVHGALHLVGFNDSDEKSRNKMRELENKFLEI